MAVFLGLYTFFLIIIWGFFIVAKIHAYKFKNFSNYIEIVTRILLVIMIVLSITGYLLIIYMNTGDRSGVINFSDRDLYFNEINY